MIPDPLGRRQIAIGSCFFVSAFSMSRAFLWPAQPKLQSVLLGATLLIAAWFIVETALGYRIARVSTRTNGGVRLRVNDLAAKFGQVRDREMLIRRSATVLLAVLGRIEPSSPIGSVMSCRLVSFGRAGLAVFVIATLSCGGSATEPIPPVVPVLTTVTVTLASPTIQVAQTTSATVTGLDQNGASIAVGAVTWSTGSASVASITAAGVVTGVAPGQTVVLVSAGGKQGQQSLTVLAVPVASVTVSPASPSLVVGGSQQLTATTLDANGATLTGRTVTWTSMNTNYATVNSSTGLATAVAAGTATIKATSETKEGTATL